MRKIELIIKQSEIIRWLLYLQGFNSFKVDHIPGLVNLDDFLSRIVDLRNNPTLYVNALNIFNRTDDSLTTENILKEKLNEQKLKETREKIIARARSNPNYAIHPDKANVRDNNKSVQKDVRLTLALLEKTNLFQN